MALATGAAFGALASGLGAGAALGAFALRAAGAGSFRCSRLAPAGAGRAGAGHAVAGSWVLRVVHGGSPWWLDDGMSSMDGVSAPRCLLDSHLRRTVCASAGLVAQVDRVDRATPGVGRNQPGFEAGRLRRQFDRASKPLPDGCDGRSQAARVRRCGPRQCWSAKAWCRRTGLDALS